MMTVLIDDELHFMMNSNLCRPGLLSLAWSRPLSRSKEKSSRRSSNLILTRCTRQWFNQVLNLSSGLYSQFLVSKCLKVPSPLLARLVIKLSRIYLADNKRDNRCIEKLKTCIISTLSDFQRQHYEDPHIFLQEWIFSDLVTRGMYFACLDDLCNQMFVILCLYSYLF